MTIRDYYDGPGLMKPPPPPPPIPPTFTEASAVVELAQLRADIKLMNEIGNRGANRYGFCQAWEAIMKLINKRTDNRLGLVGRVPLDDTYDLADNEVEYLDHD